MWALQQQAEAAEAVLERAKAALAQAGAPRRA